VDNGVKPSGTWAIDESVQKERDREKGERRRRERKRVGERDRDRDRQTDKQRNRDHIVRTHMLRCFSCHTTHTFTLLCIIHGLAPPSLCP
jgi:hypothetical protein